MRRFGFEAELSGGTSDVLSILEDKGLAPTSYLHAYHCGCDDCDHDSEWVFRGQEDCTADGEIITKILRWDSREANNAIHALACAEQEAGASTSSRVGFHVHVDASDLSPGSIIRVYRLFLLYQDEVGTLARGKDLSVRDYNQRIDRHSYSFLSGGDTEVFWRHDPDTLEPRSFGLGGKNSYWLTGPTYHDTLEFRVWNAIRSEWRMRLAAGVSVAIVDAAAAGVTVTDLTTATFAETIGPYLAPDIYAYVIRQAVYQEAIAA